MPVSRRGSSTSIATHNPRYAFIAGLATSLGAAVSMGFSEGLSDTGELTGRGSPWARGLITGGGTFIGGILHSLPFLIPHYEVALFFRDGKAMASFDPGRHVLSTQNAPILSKLAGLPYGGETPFRAEVYFVGTHLFRDLRWGTPEPVYIPDPVLMQIPIRCNGRFAIRFRIRTSSIPVMWSACACVNNTASTPLIRLAMNCLRISGEQSIRSR